MSYSDDRFKEKLLKKLDVQNSLLKELVHVLSPTEPYYIQALEQKEAPIETTSRELLETWANDMHFEISHGIRQDEEVNICLKEENTSST